MLMLQVWQDCIKFDAIGIPFIPKLCIKNWYKHEFLLMYKFRNLTGRRMLGIF